VTKHNEAFVIVDSDDSGILMEVMEHYTFFADGYRFMPLFKTRQWDGKIRLYNNRSRLLPHGLVENLLGWAKARGYSVEVGDGVAPRPVDFDSIDKFIQGLNLPFEVRAYQVEAFKSIIKDQRKLIISPTGSGKSLIAYLATRWFLENHDGKVLLIVPTTSLVEQMSKDFEDYSKQNHWNSEENIHKIYSGKDKVNFEKRIVITTWQSIFRLSKEWFEPFEMAICDEAHTAKAKSLNTIMGNLKNSWVRVGTTGTLDGTKINELTLQGHFGPTKKVITTHQLIKDDTLAKLEVKCILFEYPQAERKLIAGQKYADEVDYIVTHEKRNRFIFELAKACKGNTLVLYQYVGKHGKPLHEMFVNGLRDQDRKVFFVSGDVKAEDRENIRSMTEDEEGAILIASMGCFSTGINIKKLNNIILASPTKSQIKLLQSIGRGLRKSPDGKPTKVFDISDDLSWKKKVNYTFKHAAERVKVYIKEQFNYTVQKIQL
jgi:superfamily II DNA or RNA helicase